MGHHHELPLTGVMELRSDQLRNHPEISPRDSTNYVLTTYKSCFTNQIGIHHACQSHAILYNQPSFISHIKSIPNSSYSIHEPIPYMHIMHFMPLTYQFIQKYSKHTRTTEKIEPSAFSLSSSLRQKSLAQASSFRLGESSKREQWCCHVLSLRRDLLA